jgi:hypothetical protein
MRKVNGPRELGPKERDLDGHGLHVFMGLLMTVIAEKLKTFIVMCLKSRSYASRNNVYCVEKIIRSWFSCLVQGVDWKSPLVAHALCVLALDNQLRQNSQGFD